MSYLILDLDETTFVKDCPYRMARIDAQHHNLSETFMVSMFNSQIPIKLINPKELSDLIEYVCLNHEGVIILTRGCWHPNVLNELAVKLILSEPAREKFKKSLFHSAATDNSYFGTDPKTAGMIDKDTRLEKIIQHNAALKGKKFVALDDSNSQLIAFQRRTEQDVFTIQATTLRAQAPEFTEYKSFYENTKFALAQISKLEKPVEAKSLGQKIILKLHQSKAKMEDKLSQSNLLFFKFKIKRHSEQDNKTAVYTDDSEAALHKVI